MGRIKKVSKRGEQTIQKCKLDRRNLTFIRKKIVDKHFRRLGDNFYQSRKKAGQAKLFK